MNERIAELAEQAAQESTYGDDVLNLEIITEDMTYKVPATFIERFAELIIDEFGK